MTKVQKESGDKRAAPNSEIPKLFGEMYLLGMGAALHYSSGISKAGYAVCKSVSFMQEYRCITTELLDAIITMCAPSDNDHLQGVLSRAKALKELKEGTKAI